MRLPLPRNTRIAAVALAAAGALGAAGILHFRAASPPPATIATDPPAAHPPAPGTPLDDKGSLAPSPPVVTPTLTSASRGPAGAPPVLVLVPPPADSDAPNSPDPDDSPTPTPPQPITLEEYLQHGSKEPLVPPVIHVDATPAPGAVATAEALVPPVISVTATPIQAPADTAIAAAPIVPPAVVVAAPAAPR